MKSKKTNISILNVKMAFSGTHTATDAGTTYSFLKSNRYRSIFNPFLLSLVACTSCVQFSPPKPEVEKPENWKTKQTNQQEAPQPSFSSLPRENYEGVSKWWQVFEDEELSALEEEAILSSPTLMLATSRLKEAQSLYVAVRADLFPQINLGAFAERQHFSSDQLTQGGAAPQAAAGATPFSLSQTDLGAVSAGYEATQPPISPTTPTTPITAPTPSRPSSPKTKKTKTARNGATIPFIQVLPEISYEVDFWGKYSQATKSAMNLAKGAHESLRTAYLLLSTQIADLYFNIRAQDALILILEKTVTAYEKELQLIQDRKTSGVTSDIELMQAQVLVDKSKKEVELAKQERSFAENMLATLIGKPASSFSIEKRFFSLHVPNIPASLPAELLKKRPDIRQTECELESARLDVGVAKTAFFPSIVLSASYGYEAAKFENLFKWRNHIWSAAAALSQSVFDGGRNYGNLQAAKARYENRLANFLNTVITAYGEVENALSAVDTSKKRHELSSLEAKSASNKTKLIELQYTSGIANYLAVLDAETQLLETEKTVIQTKKDEVLAALSLIKSLGGNW